jgi:phospholipid/cholesterol/gamma-HCH transport system substrate-binding protein
MANKAQSIRVGLFTAATAVLLAVVVIVFGGLRFWESSDHYHIVFDTSVYGLESGAEVYLNGIKVGTVETIRVAPEDIRKVAVAIKLKHGTPVHTDTRAMLQYAGITGLKVIDLRGGTLATAALPPNSQIVAGQGLLDKLEAQAQTIVDESTQLIQSAHRVSDNLAQVTSNLGSITEPAARAAQNLEATTGALHAMVDENRAGLRDTLTAIRKTATGASALIDTQGAQLFGDAGDAVAELKKLITANEAPLRAVMFDLRQASRSFKELVHDVRQKPSRLLFSSTPSERKLP